MSWETLFICLHDQHVYAHLRGGGKNLRGQQEEGKFPAACRASRVICEKPIVRINYENGKVVYRQSRGMTHADYMSGNEKKDKIPNVQERHLRT